MLVGVGLLGHGDDRAGFQTGRNAGMRRGEIKDICEIWRKKACVSRTGRKKSLTMTCIFNNKATSRARNSLIGSEHLHPEHTHTHTPAGGDRAALRTLISE